MRDGIIISNKTFKDIVRLKDEFGSIIETIEIMNDKKLMKQIRRSEKEARAGKVKEIKTKKDIQELFN